MQRDANRPVRDATPLAMSLPPFEMVVQEHGAAVLRACRGMVGPSEADDVWSETFISALRAYPQLRAGSNVRGWLVTIAHRKAIDFLRAKAKAPIALDQLPDGAAPPSEPSAIGSAVWAALAGLPPKQRAAVVYHYLAELPYATIAGLLGSSEQAARRAAADGIAALRAALEREDST